MNPLLPKHESITHLHILSCINTLILNDQNLRHLKCVRILDAGCGDGKLISYLTSGLSRLHEDKEFFVYGFDIFDHGVQDSGFLVQSIGMLSELHPHIDWSSRIYALGANDAWSFSERKFEIIISNQVLEHVADKMSFFKNIYNNLIDGGCSIHLAPLKHCIQEGHILIPLAHKFDSFSGLLGYIQFMSRLGFGKFSRQRRSSTPELEQWAVRHADYIYFWTNYSTESETLNFCRMNRLRADFKYSLEFYISKAKDIIGAKPKYSYRYRDLGFLDLIMVKILRYISSVTLVCKKENKY